MEGKARLKLLRTLLEDYEISPELIYPTHVERSEEFMREAIELAARGSHVDIDTVERDLHKWLRFYLDNGGNPARLTVSSDASINNPQSLLGQIRACVVEHNFSFEQTLAQGRRLVRDGQLTFSEKFLDESNRLIRLEGQLRGLA